MTKKNKPLPNGYQDLFDAGKANALAPLAPAPKSGDVHSNDAGVRISENADDINTGKPEKKCKNSKTNSSTKTTVKKKKSGSSKSGNRHKASNLQPMTYKLPPDFIESIRRIAYWQRRDIQEVAAEVIRRGLEGYPGTDLLKIPPR